MTSTKNYLETLYHDLALALGDAVWAFAKVEWVTWKALGKLSKEPNLAEIVGDVSFKTRLDMLRRLIHQNKAGAQEKKFATDAIAVVEKLAAERNLIAHNPWKVWVDIDKNDFMTEIQKYSKPSKNVNLSRLKEFVDEVTVAEINLQNAIDAL